MYQGKYYEMRYQAFEKLHQRGVNIKAISRKIGVTPYYLRGDDFLGRFNEEHHVIEQPKLGNNAKIDTKKMMSLIYQIQRKYHTNHIESWIPDDDVLMVELHRVVHAN